MGKIINFNQFREKINNIRTEEITEMQLLGILEHHSGEEKEHAGSACAIPLADGSLRISMTVPPDTDPLEYFKLHYPYFLEAMDGI